MAVDRFEVYLIDLDPTVGSEIQKTLIKKLGKLDNQTSSSVLAVLQEMFAP